MPLPAQLQTSRAAQASPLLAQTILLFVTPAFSGLLTSRLSGIPLSNTGTCSSLPRLKKRTGSPFDPVPLQLLPPIPGKRPPESCSFACLCFSPLMYLPAHQSLASALRPPLRRPCQVAGFFQDAKRSAPPRLRSAPALRALLASPTALLRSVCGTAFPCFSPHPWHPSCQVRPPPSALQPQAASLPSSSEL